jgi:hypothetical protein
VAAVAIPLVGTRDLVTATFFTFLYIVLALNFTGGGLDGPLRNLPQNGIAAAKPPLEVDRSIVGGSA